MTAQESSSQAIGMIEVEGVAGIVQAADTACKAAAVAVLGWESTGGYSTVFLGGSVGDVSVALRRGEAAARELVDHVVVAAMNQPEPECRLCIGFPATGAPHAGDLSLGMVETRGYGIHVDVNDRMLKAAEVDVLNVLTVYNRVVCTLIGGEVGAVREAVEASRQLLSAYEHLLCTSVIPQPVPEVVSLFGGAR